MRELFFHILNGAAVRIGGAIKRIGSAPGAKYSLKDGFNSFPFEIFIKRMKLSRFV